MLTFDRCRLAAGVTVTAVGQSLARAGSRTSPVGACRATRPVAADDVIQVLRGGQARG